VADWRLATRRSTSFPSQAALLDRRVGHDRDAARATLRQQRRLDAAARQVVEHLVRRWRAARGGRVEIHHVADVEIADAPMADLPGAGERVERLERLVERRAAAPVQEIEIEPVGAQAPEARLAGGDRAAPRRMVRQHLADEEDAGPLTFDGLGDQLLRQAPPPYISAVSISVIPRSIPNRSAAISPARRPGRSAMFHVPWPRTGDRFARRQRRRAEGSFRGNGAQP
jgi:hypothetical protein